MLFIKKNIKLILVLTFLVVISIISVQSSDLENQLNPVFMLALRFIHNGDIYWYAYPNDVYKVIDGSRGLAALFTDLFGFLRIYDWDSLPKAIGITFKNIHHPSDIPSGPNARHNVFGLIFYGFWGSLVFSFFLGTIISFVRNKLPYLMKSNLISGFVFAYLFLKTGGLDTDPMLTLTYVNNLVFIFPMIFIPFLFVFEIINRKQI